MQFAERWLGIGSVVVALAGLGTLAVQLAPHHRHHHGNAQFDSGRINCRGLPVTANPETIHAALLRDQEPDLYGPVLAIAETRQCLTTATARVDMLIEIAADGHVTRASNRPERPTAESRCIAKAVRELHFPVSPSAVSLRNVFTR